MYCKNDKLFMEKTILKLTVEKLKNKNKITMRYNHSSWSAMSLTHISIVCVNQISNLL